MLMFIDLTYLLVKIGYVHYVLIFLFLSYGAIEKLTHTVPAQWK